MKDVNSYRYAAEHLDELGIINQSVKYEDGIYTRKVIKPPHLVICGAGHVSHALSTVAESIGFQVTVIDDRAEFANTKRFRCGVHVICGDYLAALMSIKDKNAWYAVMTRGHAYDEVCAEAIMKHSYHYIGMMGSASKTEHTKKILKERGIAQERIDSLHAPIGIKIGACTPEEIAISVAAELIQERAKAGHFCLDSGVCNALQTVKGALVAATIINKTGSAPRDRGSCLVVDTENGSVYGTIGGGAVEAAAIAEAKNMIAGAKPFTRYYDLVNGSPSNLNMVCGGRVRVLFEYIPPLE